MREREEKKEKQREKIHKFMFSCKTKFTVYQLASKKKKKKNHAITLAS